MYETLWYDEMETSMCEEMETEVTEQPPVLQMKLQHRAQELPLVKSATTYVATFYQQAKDYSPLVNSTLNMAESGAKLAGLVASPVATRFDDNLHKVACDALDALETRYPAVMMETEEVSARLVTAGSKVRDGAEKIAGALVESTPGQFALMQLAEYLRIANEVSTFALPEDRSEPSSSKSFQYQNLALLNVSISSEKLYSRIYRLYSRICKLSTVQLEQLQDMSTKGLYGLQSQLTALELATKNSLKRSGIKGRTEKLWQQLQFTTNSMYQQSLLVAGQISSSAGSLELAQQIASQLVSLYATASIFATNLPSAVESALLRSKSHADKLYIQLSLAKSMEEFTALAYSEMEEFQSSVACLFENASTLPHLQTATAPGTISNVAWQACMEPIQEHEEMADIKKLLFVMIVYNILYGFVLLYSTCFAKPWIIF